MIEWGRYKKVCIRYVIIRISQKIIIISGRGGGRSTPGWSGGKGDRVRVCARTVDGLIAIVNEQKVEQQRST